MRKVSLKFAVAILFIGMLSSIFVNKSSGYTDTSTYKVETTAAFLGLEDAQKNLQKLKTNTGWDAVYQKTSDYKNVYNLVSGGFPTESRVKTSLQEFESSTGINADYVPNGTKDYYYYVSSGGFSSKSKTESVAQSFTKKTGISASVEPVDTTKDYYYQLISGGFVGESKVKAVLSDFTKETGLDGTYKPVGDPEKYYTLTSGGFNSESKVKSILSKFTKETGINGTYKPAGNPEKYYVLTSGGFSSESATQTNLEKFETGTGIKGRVQPVGDPVEYYNIRTGGFGSESLVKNYIQEIKEATNLTAEYEQVPNSTSFRILFHDLNAADREKAEQYLMKKNWWFSTQKSDKQTYERYKIVSDPVLGMTAVNKGLEFFKKNSWYVSYKETGEQAYTKFKIYSDPILGDSLLAKGLEFFKSNNWYAGYQDTGKEGYTRFKIYSNPVLGMDQVNKGLEFFKKNSWYAGYQKTGKTGYSSYRVVSNQVLGKAQAQKGLEFFQSNDWWAKIVNTGKAGYSSYRIETGRTLLYDDLLKAQDFFKKKGWWSSYTSERQYLYKITVDNIQGYNNASATANQLKSDFGWSVNIVKTNDGPQIMYTDYGLTLAEMLKKQMSVNPQTDSPGYVSLTYINTANSTVTADYLNVRSSPKVANNNIVGLLQKGDKVSMTGTDGNWAKINMGWRNASEDETGYYINPNNFSMDSKYYFQFLKLSQYAGLSASEINSKILKGKGILDGKGAAFVEASKKYNINELYLISHALLETGNGTSQLAKGVKYNGKTVYNMYGYGAYDSCPLECGSKTAYEQGWDTPEKAIIGGAELIGKNYIHRSGFQQDTLFKMRWAPTASHQYATDIGWAYKQVSRMYSLYTLLDNYTLYYDIPKYK
ncbi:N-acetylglucosaminidase [Bacillus swezeyi]|uniref:Beta-N-acetylglucosaminidase n=1 Tax=Bacillus swezeyi TaxID=1925020 RepID=A0A5M8RQI3_9BACI|nr:N-acetylglucosaminidase [Bacillus swezeyi]KAA6450847.1 beta-N-acetylglucosaminidase [Bacillus swezeyi]TYS37381.1 SH3 domain-containing protein [Bacillus swezeyi]